MTLPEPSDHTVRPEILAAHGAAVAAGALRAPVAALTDAAEALAAVLATGALPDDRASVAAVALARRWERAATLWAADVVAHGEALGAAAADYAEGDDAAARSFGAPA